MSPQSTGRDSHGHIQTGKANIHFREGLREWGELKESFLTEEAFWSVLKDEQAERKA